MANPYIADLYKSALGRDADAGGLAYWDNLSKNMSESDLKNAFFQSAAKEAQKDDTGLSAATDKWDENRIASAMQFYDGRGGFAANAGDTGTTSAAQRLAGLPANQFNFGSTPTAPTSTFQQNNAGITAPTMSGYEKNPYLDQMAQGITQQMNDNWTRNLAPSIRSGAMAAGGFGGSRQGVVEANGLNDMNRSLSQNLANLYGGDYQQSQQRNLQKYGMDQSYNLGMAGNNLGFAGLDANIAQNNFNNSLNSANFGLNAYNTLNANNAAGVNSATQIQNTPITQNGYFNGQYQQYGGMGGSTTGTQGTSSNGAVNGAAIGSFVGNLGIGGNGFSGINPYNQNLPTRGGQ